MEHLNKIDLDLFIIIILGIALIFVPKELKMQIVAGFIGYMSKKR